MVFLLLGTLSGLVQHCCRQPHHLSTREPTNGLSVFIAWINLDLGLKHGSIMEWILTAKHGCNFCSLYIFGC